MSLIIQVQIFLDESIEKRLPNGQRKRVQAFQSKLTAINFPKQVNVFKNSISTDTFGQRKELESSTCLI